MKNIIRSTGVVLRSHDDSRVIKFRASTPALDRHGTIIKSEGIKTKNFRKNPLFLWGHDGYETFSGPPDMDSIIGRVIGFEQSKEAFDIDVEFVDEETNPKGERALKLTRGGFLKSVSIG